MAQGETIQAGKRRGRRWLWVHGWLGVLAALPLVVQGLTGALLGYERELRNGLGDGAVEAGERRLGWGELEQEIEAQLPAGAATMLLYVSDPREPVWIRWQADDETSSSYLANPYTGELLRESTGWHRVFEGILLVHRQLGAGRLGQVIMGTSALGLAVLVISGWVVQWQRTRRTGRFFGAGWRRWSGLRSWMVGLHGVAGVWLSPLLLVLALTGPVWTFASYRAVIGWLTQSEAAYGQTAAALEPGEAALDRQRIFAAAAALDEEHGVDRATAARLVFPTVSGQAVRYEWAAADAPHENFRSRHLLHPSTGAILETYLLSDYTRAETAVRWAYPLHIGRWGGELTRLLTVLAALSLPLLAGSGLWLFWKRNFKR